MPRGKIQLRQVNPDLIYNSVAVSKFINHMMKGGKKSASAKIMYKALEIVKEKSKKNPVEVFETALVNITPQVEVKSRRVGGATYQVPMEVKGNRKNSLGMRWLLTAARAHKGKPMADSLSDEILLAFKNEGAAIKKKEDTHRMAEANRAFAHFAW
ncbi:MAG: 30S ribosomal protein S7 [Patescibacteria group bacterium]|nr:30S ribosomal protein S7 [Patescibacteria group bacterium]